MRGVKLRCFGEVRSGPSSLEMIHPEYQRIEEEHENAVEESLTPIYPTTEGMHQLSWRGMSEQALQLLEQDANGLPEWLPQELLSKMQLTELGAAVRFLHRPPPDADQNLLLTGKHPAKAPGL